MSEAEFGRPQKLYCEDLGVNRVTQQSLGRSWLRSPARAVVLLLLLALSALTFLGCSAEPTAAEQVRDEAIAWIEQAPTRATDHPLSEYFYTEGGRTVFRTVPSDSLWPQGKSGFDPVFCSGG